MSKWVEPAYERLIDIQKTLAANPRYFSLTHAGAGLCQYEEGAGGIKQQARLQTIPARYQQEFVNLLLIMHLKEEQNKANFCLVLHGSRRCRKLRVVSQNESRQRLAERFLLRRPAG